MGKTKILAACAVATLLLTGCAVEQSAPVATPSVSPSATESPSATSAEPAVVDIELAINSLPEELSIAGLRRHFLELNQAVASLEPIKIDYQTGPTADPAAVQKVIDSFAGKLKLFQPLGLQRLDQDWLLVSELDYKWWRDYRLSQDASWPVELWDEARNEFGHCRLSDDVFCGTGNTVSDRNYQDNVVGTKFVNRGLDYVARHEAVHFYQAIFGYGGTCWFAEGQATFFETYLETTSRNRDQVLARLRTSPTGIAEANAEQFAELLATDMICGDDYTVAYDLGMLAFEYLYLNYTFVQVHQLMQLSSTDSWNEAVAAVLGITAQELHAELAEYLEAQLS